MCLIQHTHKCLTRRVTPELRTARSTSLIYLSGAHSFLKVNTFPLHCLLASLRKALTMPLLWCNRLAHWHRIQSATKFVHFHELFKNPLRFGVHLDKWARLCTGEDVDSSNQITVVSGACLGFFCYCRGFHISAILLTIEIICPIAWGGLGSLQFFLLWWLIRQVCRACRSW